MGRLERYVDINDNIFKDLSDILIKESTIVPDSVFYNIKLIGDKVGLKIKRSDTVFDYLESAGKEVAKIIGLVCQYIVTRDKTEKETLKNTIKSEIDSVNRKRIASFFMEVDKATFGLLSIVRLVLRNIFGVEITNYKKWSKDIEYVLSKLDSIKKVLMGMNPTKEEIDAFNNFYDVVIKTKEEYEKMNEGKLLGTIDEDEGCSGEGYTDPGAATTTGNIEKSYPRLGAPARRTPKKKNKKLRKHLMTVKE